MVSNTNKGTGGLEDVNWSRTLAYAVGLNSVYTNLANRESQGILTQDQHMELLPRLKEQLENWQGPDGQPVVQRVLFQWEAFQGPYSRQGPDLVIGYSPGYRASAETGLGKWKESSIERNNDHWRADHCVNSQSVPAVLFSNSTLQGFSHLSFRDIPALVLGKPIEQTHFEPHPPSSLPEEDRKALEERLKSLGYL